MKRSQSIHIQREHRHRRLLETAGVLLVAISLRAADAPPTSPAPPANAPAVEQAPAKSPPLPLHQIEGNGGVFSTLSAYIVNPPRNGEPIGRPSVGFAYVNLGHDINLEAVTLTESPLSRLELGYGWNRLGLGDLPDVLGIPTKDLQLHNANARFQLIKENDFGQKWVPALTLGGHFKYNDGIRQVNSDVGGALAAAGIRHNTSADVTLYASKLFPKLPRPVLFEVGGRATQGAWNGLGGFTSHYSFLFEGNVVVFVTDRLLLAAEYKQLAYDYQRIGNLVKPASDWWTLDAAYVVSKHLTVAAGYGHFGNVLNHEANGVWGLTTKFEF